MFPFCKVLCRAMLLAWLLASAPALAQGSGATAPTPRTPASRDGVADSGPAPAALSSGGDAVKSLGLPDLTKRETFSSALQLVVLLTVLSLAPAILIMMTSFTRIVIVLSLLRQALGTASLPPNQVLVALSLFMTFLVMGPTFTKINHDALQPYLNNEPEVTQKVAIERAAGSLRDFMIAQIENTGNKEDVLLFTDHAGRKIETWGDVPTQALIPAFMLSELKTAFLLGFKIYLPFLIVDMVISAILISMGMMMLPPVLVSLPFKLLLFVLVDGWRLISASLIGSFVT
ncbi:MAG: flagellar type III secretion system pore protein FliP [Tepidisphaerales bacterium]